MSYVRTINVNECGHPDVPYCALGMCRKCYSASYHAGTLPERTVTLADQESICHPGEPRVNRNGLCLKCYFRGRYLLRHPDAATKEERNRDGLATCHPDRIRHHSSGLCQSCYSRRVRYGADFVAMYKEQDGRCKCCGDEVEESLMHTDHNHKTMMVRGLICRTCNLILGFVEHEKYDLALAYLKANP
jgi:hypothetical protein